MKTKMRFSIFGAYAFAIRKAPAATILLTLFEITNGLVLPLQIILLRNFLDTTLAFFNQAAALQDVLYWLLLLTLLYVYNAFGDTILNLADIKLEHRMRSEFESLILDKQARLLYSYVDDAGIYDLLRQVNDTPSIRFKLSIRTLLQVLSDIIQIGGLILMIFSAGWYVGTGLLITAIFIYFTSNKLGAGLHTWWEKNIKHQRRYEYFTNLLLGREFAAEHRIFGFRGYLKENWQQAFDQYNRSFIRNHLKARFKGNLAIALSALFKLGIYLLLIQSLIIGTITFGFYLALARSIGNVQNFVAVQMSKRMIDLSRLKGYWKNVNIFFGLEEIVLEERSREKADFAEIQFLNVWFRYPHSPDYVLKDVSFTLRNGSHYSLVGENGAGKSTIIKLLLGLYIPEKGSILIDGKDIHENYSRSLDHFAVVYQDFVKYSLTVRENIGFGNIKQLNDDETIADMAQKGDIHSRIMKLPEQYGTILGKVQETGTDLSRGEWQKIAFCRALMSGAPVLILDEPTSALDPVAECVLYENFNRIMTGKTAFFISHRLGSTKLADTIFVLADGAIAEQGSHTELLALNGTYAKMYNDQKSWYGEAANG